MKIQAYFDQIKTTVDPYVRTRFVLEAKVNFDLRPAEQGYINGEIHFTDGSILYFREFLDVLDDIVDELMYSYHFQDAGNNLIFRYDNAKHKPALPFVEHKHLPEQILEATAPTLADVLSEVFSVKGWI